MYNMSSSDYQLKIADEADAMDIMRIVNEAYDVECKVFKKVPRMVDLWEFRSAYHESRVIKAVDTDNNIVGMILLEFGDGVAHFGPLAVDPKYRGLGIAKSLVTYAEKTAAAQGFGIMEIFVACLREELFTYYERMGYNKCGTRPYPHPEKLSRPVHFVIMSKSLTE